MSSSLFELHQVAYSYREALALDGLSLEIRRGQRVALLGANGSGKSTLLRLLAGLYFAARGAVRFDGVELTEEKFADDEFAYGFRRRVGLVFQNPDVQLFNPTVFDELAFGPLQLGWPREQIVAAVEETLAALELPHLRDRTPHRLSGGEKKRVALASVLILAPEAILLDEPTDALDPKSQCQVVELLASWRNSARTVITTTHDLAIVPEIADHCVILQAGRVAAEGAPDELLRDEALLSRTGLRYRRQSLA